MLAQVELMLRVVNVNLVMPLAKSAKMEPLIPAHPVQPISYSKEALV
jgi:hypothetical protein